MQWPECATLRLASAGDRGRRRLQSVAGHLHEKNPVEISQAAADSTSDSGELVLTLASGQVSSTGGKLKALRRSSVES